LFTDGSHDIHRALSADPEPPLQAPDIGPRFVARANRKCIGRLKSAISTVAYQPFVTLFGLYSLVVVLGILSMGFQLLGSRLLAPHFGSSIIPWAWLISTFLLAFSLGSMLGGWISNRPPVTRFRLQIALAVVAVFAFAYTAIFGRPTLDWIELRFLIQADSLNSALFVSCIGLFFMPVTMLSTFGPQCVQYLAVRGTSPGFASGLIYGISTVGNIAGVMLTAFALIPNFGISRLLYLWLAIAVFSLGGLILILRQPAPNVP